jgi:hypothetical protein
MVLFVIWLFVLFTVVREHRKASVIVIRELNHIQIEFDENIDRKYT